MLVHQKEQVHWSYWHFLEQYFSTIFYRIFGANKGKSKNKVFELKLEPTNLDKKGYIMGSKEKSKAIITLAS